MVPFRESQSSIMTYSSLQTKQIVQYQSGTILRQLAATGSLESQFMPTALLQTLSGADGLPLTAELAAGYRFPPWNQGFNPNLLMQLEAMTVSTTANREIGFTVDFSFDVAVRGLRNTQ